MQISISGLILNRYSADICIRFDLCFQELLSWRPKTAEIHKGVEIDAFSMFRMFALSDALKRNIFPTATEFENVIGKL